MSRTPNNDTPRAQPTPRRRAAKPARQREDAAPAAKGDVCERVVAFATRFRAPLIVGAVLLAVLAYLYEPAKGYYQAWRANGVHQAALDELNESIEDSRGDISRLQSSEGIEDEARKKGLVKEGEVPVTVEGLPEGDESQAEDASELPWYIELGDFVFQYGGK